MGIKKDLKHTIHAAKTLKEFDKILFRVAEDTKRRIVNLWLKGFGADSMKFSKPLSEPYATKKGVGNTRTLHLTSHMAEEMAPRKSGDGYIIGWTNIKTLGQARGNQKYAPNMMKVGDKLESAANKAASKLFWQEVNKA